MRYEPFQGHFTGRISAAGWRTLVRSTKETAGRCTYRLFAGRIGLAGGKDKQVLAALQELAGCYPRNVLYRYKLYRLLYSQGQQVEAKEHLKEAVLLSHADGNGRCPDVRKNRFLFLSFSCRRIIVASSTGYGYAFRFREIRFYYLLLGKNG